MPCSQPAVVSVTAGQYCGCEPPRRANLLARGARVELIGSGSTASEGRITRSPENAPQHPEVQRSVKALRHAVSIRSSRSVATARS